VCRLCQALSYEDGTTGSVPIEDGVHFIMHVGLQGFLPCSGHFPLLFNNSGMVIVSVVSITVIMCQLFGASQTWTKSGCLQLHEDGSQTW